MTSKVVSKGKKNVKARHLFGDVEILLQTRESVEVQFSPPVKAIIKSYEDILRSLFNLHGDNRIVYAPYGNFLAKKKGRWQAAGVEILLHKCCGVDEEQLRMLNKISKFDTGEYPATDVKIEACDDPTHQKFSKTLGETFTCTVVKIDVDFTKWDK